MRLLKRIVVFTLLFIVAVFAAMNPTSVDLDLLLMQAQLPLGLALIGAVLVGMLCGALLVLMRRPHKPQPQSATSPTTKSHGVP